MMADTGGRDVTVEFSDWGLSLHRQQVLAREITDLLARVLDIDDRDAVNVRSTATGPVISLSAGCCSSGGFPPSPGSPSCSPGRAVLLSGAFPRVPALLVIPSAPGRGSRPAALISLAVFGSLRWGEHARTGRASVIPQTGPAHRRPGSNRPGGAVTITKLNTGQITQASL